MSDGGDLFKTGLIVENLARAMDSLGKALGLSWTPVQVADLVLRLDGGSESVQLPFVYSLSGPPYLELLQAQPGGYYAATQCGQIHHAGLWVDDLAAESKRLEDEGFALEAAGEREGVSPAIFAFHTNPFGLRLELVDRAMQPSFLGWIAGGELAL